MYSYMLSTPFIYVFCIVEVWYESFNGQVCLFLFSLKQHRVASSKLTYVVKIPNQISWCLNLRVLVTNNLLKLNSSLIVIRIMLFSPHKFCLILVFHVEPSHVLEDHNIIHPLLHSILLEWGVRFLWLPHIYLCLPSSRNFRNHWSLGTLCSHVQIYKTSQNYKTIQIYKTIQKLRPI